MSTGKPFLSSLLQYTPLEETLDLKVKGKPLHIGIPKEFAFQENRVCLTPEAVGVLVSEGNEIVVEHNAGLASHYPDAEYLEAGATVSHDKSTVYKAGILLKSAPVMSEDVSMLQMGQTIISPLHHAALNTEIVEQMLEKRITAICFENLKDDNLTYPIVRSMSEIAGAALMLIAGQYLSSFNKGKGVLLGGISGIPPTKVVILGAGIVGQVAARNALALGASVKIFDNDVFRLTQLQNNLGHRVWTSVLEPRILAKQLKTCEVAIGALSNDYGRAPMVVTEAMVSHMRPGSIIIDVAIDRGGCFETSELTSHESPVFVKHRVIHYCVPNIPSGFARTASQALSNVLMPLMLRTNEVGGIENLILSNGNIREGIYMFKGCLTNQYISQLFNLKFTDLDLLIASRG